MQKSIEVLTNYQNHITPGAKGDVIISVEFAQALKDAVTAMQKQIPMEMHKFSDIMNICPGEDSWMCKNCGSHISDIGCYVPDYCEECGQRLEKPNDSI